MKKTLLLTGAEGFLGTHLTTEFVRQGWIVHGLVRNPGTKRLPAGLSDCYDYSLASGPEPSALALRPDAVIHAAFQTRGSAGPESSAENLHAAEVLIERYVRRQNAFFVFISSMSAHDGALSHYGRNKRRIETALDLGESLVVRPGFVIGPGGIFQRLARTLSRAWVAPMPYGGQLPIQTADVRELSRAIEQLTSARTAGLYSFGTPEPVPIASFYKAVVAWMGQRIALIPVPGTPVLHLVRAMERCGIAMPLTSENLLGLRGLIHQPVEPIIAKLGWRPASLSEILNRYDPRMVREQA